MPELEGVKQIATANVASSGELEAAFDGPAVYANKVLITLTATMGRLSFVEIPPYGGAPAYRAAVSMGISELVALRTLLSKMLADENIATLPQQAAADADTE